MEQYIAFLRAVNVGGRVVKMDKLRDMFVSLGVKNVKTYIQSGNVIFDAGGNISALRKKIETLLQKELGYEIPTMIRTVAEVANIAENNPLKKVKLAEGAKTYVSFLSEEPAKEVVRSLLALNNEDLTFHISKSEVYSIISKKASDKAPFSNAYLEKKIGMAATTRNLSIPGKIIQFLNK
ncbi:MAG TPA: DUF1697 domain-containing protein [Candidatus Kapabacteria bacterium]|nr:DUF1697 domain-containing protein [Candidatus Kapabacteria bacterium]